MGKLVFRFLLTIFILTLIAAAAAFCFLYFTQYKPSGHEPLLIRNPSQQQLIPNEQYTITTFNIGFASMDRENIQSSSSPLLTTARTIEQINKHLSAIINQMNTLDSDFFTLQEVDLAAARTHKFNQSEAITRQLSHYSSAFAYTYNTAFIPFPIKAPVGQLESGLLTLSKYATESHTRIVLPNEAGKVTHLNEQHYALIETILPVRGNKKLIIANLQLANSKTGSTLSREQFEFLTDYINSRQLEGNYLILSGDWAHFIITPSFKSSELWPISLQAIPPYFTIKNMSFAIDKANPTKRSTEHAYEHGLSFVTITDGFLVSNNIEVVSTVTTQLQFMYSDHNPVTLTFLLK